MRCTTQEQCRPCPLLSSLRHVKGAWAGAQRSPRNTYTRVTTQQPSAISIFESSGFTLGCFCKRLFGYETCRESAFILRQINAVFTLPDRPEVALKHRLAAL